MVYPIVRQAPSGPKVNSLKNGAVIQFDNEMTVVTNGDIDQTPREVQADMSGAVPTLRPVLDAPNPTSEVMIEGDLDILFDDSWVSQNIETSVEVSLDQGASWDVVGGSVMEIPSTSPGAGGIRLRNHFKVSSPTFLLSSLPSFDPANPPDDATARVTVVKSSAAAGSCNVVTDSAIGTVRLGILELFNEV